MLKTLHVRGPDGDAGENWSQRRARHLLIVAGLLPPSLAQINPYRKSSGTPPTAEYVAVLTKVTNRERSGLMLASRALEFPKNAVLPD